MNDISILLHWLTMSQSVRGLPDPTPKAVQIFLKQLGRPHLHEAGWIEINKRFHGLSRAMRPFIQEHFETPEEQEAAFDGLTVALLTMSHFQDISQLADLFQQQVPAKKQEASKEPDPDKLPKTG